MLGVLYKMLRWMSIVNLGFLVVVIGLSGIFEDIGIIVMKIIEVLFNY